jgi:hypothetical protein
MQILTSVDIDKDARDDPLIRWAKNRINLMSSYL